jgi:hypothetical protein
MGLLFPRVEAMTTARRGPRTHRGNENYPERALARNRAINQNSRISFVCSAFHSMFWIFSGDLSCN